MNMILKTMDRLQPNRLIYH